MISMYISEINWCKKSTNLQVYIGPKKHFNTYIILTVTDDVIFQPYGWNVTSCDIATIWLISYHL